MSEVNKDRVQPRAIKGFLLARHISMPVFLSTKRSRVITIAAAGTLTLVTAVTAAAAALPAAGSVASAAAAGANLDMAAQHPAASTAFSGPNGPQQLIDFQRERSAEHTREARLTAARLREAQRREAAAAAQQSAEQSANTAATQQTQAAETAPSGSPQQITQSMLSQYGWSASQFSCLEPLWQQESGWSVTAENPSSGAYGIPQALPGSKMASAGADWESDAATQIRWGLQYIASLYGSPCGAWDHEEADGWY
jgi:hypothetical protein